MERITDQFLEVAVCALMYRKSNHAWNSRMMKTPGSKIARVIPCPSFLMTTNSFTLMEGGLITPGLCTDNSRFHATESPYWLPNEYDPNFVCD